MTKKGDDWNIFVWNLKPDEHLEVGQEFKISADKFAGKGRSVRVTILLPKDIKITAKKGSWLGKEAVQVCQACQGTKWINKLAGGNERCPACRTEPGDKVNE